MADKQRLLREAFAANRGEEIDTQGDSFLAAFRSARDALVAAIAIQRSLAAHAWPEGSGVRIRIGIHTGEAAAAGERYVGLSVHRAARVGAAAHGGQVLLSSSTRELVEDDLPEGVFLRDLGVHRLKDIDRPERISQLAAEGLRVEFHRFAGRTWSSPRRSSDALTRCRDGRRGDRCRGRDPGVCARRQPSFRVRLRQTPGSVARERCARPKVCA